MKNEVIKLPLLEAYEEVRLLEEYLSKYFLLPEQLTVLLEGFLENTGLIKNELMTLKQLKEYKKYLQVIHEQLMKTNII